MTSVLAALVFLSLISGAAALPASQKGQCSQMGHIGAYCGSRMNQCQDPTGNGGCEGDTGGLHPPGPCQTACQDAGGVYSWCPAPGPGGPPACRCDKPGLNATNTLMNCTTAEKTEPTVQPQ